MKVERRGASEGETEGKRDKGKEGGKGEREEEWKYMYVHVRGKGRDGIEEEMSIRILAYVYYRGPAQDVSYGGFRPGFDQHK